MGARESGPLRGLGLVTKGQPHVKVKDVTSYRARGVVVDGRNLAVLLILEGHALEG